jgi:putative NIF3 family GTP cyclohydrolase 1 type 2
MKLEEVVDYQNALLRIADYPDYPNALNGLQIENSGTVTKVAAAVDACEAVLQMAVSQGADLLIVHHGLFWAGLRTVTGAHYRKLKMALENNLAIYSAHLPLDAHPEIGNNAVLCNALGLPSRGGLSLKSDGRSKRSGIGKTCTGKSRKPWEGKSISALADQRQLAESAW